MAIATAALAAVICCGVQNARAYGDAPWCAVVDVGAGSVVWDCRYRSIEECTPNVVAGSRGFCNLNPYAQGPLSYAPRTVAHGHVAHRHRPRHVTQ
jgi:hypothetical protein